jgi:hypothetical protein
MTQTLAKANVRRSLIVHLRAKSEMLLSSHLMDCARTFCLWFSLPLSIWLNSGLIGLLLHWQALTYRACLLEKVIAKLELLFPQVPLLKGDAPCALADSEAQ